MVVHFLDLIFYNLVPVHDNKYIYGDIYLILKQRLYFSSILHRVNIRLIKDEYISESRDLFSHQNKTK